MGWVCTWCIFTLCAYSHYVTVHVIWLSYENAIPEGAEFIQGDIKSLEDVKRAVRRYGGMLLKYGRSC